jgi:hypothetical protein
MVLLFVGAFLIARPLMKCPKTTRQKKNALGRKGREELVTHAWTGPFVVNG